MYIYRYGDDINKRMDERTADFMELLQVDQLKRQLAMMSEVRNIKHMLEGKPLNSVVDTSDTYVLSLCINEAKNLPKMDILHGIDSYCVVSVDNIKEEVYQTHVVPKARNPVWNAHFEWTVPVQAQLITIAVIDHDVISNDDLVSVSFCHGVVMVTVTVTVAVTVTEY
jgi:hypothetical protein